MSTKSTTVLLTGGPLGGLRRNLEHDPKTREPRKVVGVAGVALLDKLETPLPRGVGRYTRTGTNRAGLPVYAWSRG